VRIDGTSGTETNALSESSVFSKQAKPADASEATPSTESQAFVSSAAPYVSQVQATDEVDSQAVLEAKQLLKSGQLDTPEAAQRAAQAILDLGI
jgi:hypothetical protein